MASMREFQVSLLLLALGCGAKAPLGAPCDLTTEAPCAPWGLGCTALPDGGAVCALPGEFLGCAREVGCARASLVCAGPFPGSPAYSCLEPCAATPDCQDPDTFCQDAGPGLFCVPNGCGPGSGPDGGTINGATFFGPCDSSAKGDGTCLPYPEAPGLLPFGVCLAAGTADVGVACFSDRTDAGATTLCAPGLSCDQPDKAKPGSCAPLCAASADGGPAGDAGPACALGTSCEAALEPGFLAGLCVAGG